MFKLIFLAALTQIAVATSPVVLAFNTQPEQIVQSQNANQLLQQGLKLYQTEQLSQAVQVLQQAAAAFQSQGDVLNQARALNYVALAFQQLGLPQASKAITESLTLLQKNDISSKDYLSVRAQALNTQGQIQLAQGQFEKALASWQSATTLYSKIRDNAGEIGSKINQAQAQQALGLYNRAGITLTEVNQRLQQQPDPELKAKGLLSLGNALRVVGILNVTNQDRGIHKLGSKQALQQSLAVASKLNSGQLVAEIHLSLGNTEQALRNITEALAQYQQATTFASPMTKLVAQMNQLRLATESIEARKQVSYQALLPQIQSQLETLPPSHKTVYARINYAQSLTCLKSQNQAITCPKQENEAQKQEKEAQEITTNGIPEWSAIAQIVATAVEQAKRLGDNRGEAYALGTLGGLYELTQQWDSAQKLTQQASALAESIAAKDIGYRWQWQLGRILKVRGNQPAAIAAYSKAVENLKSLRSDLVANRYEQFSFQEGVEPVFREFVSLLLQSSQPSQDNLATARNVIESLQLAELDNFFRRACLDARPVQIDEVDRTAAVIYPIILSDRLEVILSVPSTSGNQKQRQILRRHTIHLSQKQVEDKISQLRQKLETRSTPEYLPFSQEVYSWIIQPIASELAVHKIKNLVFVLDGSLRNIPMGALYDGKQFLVENYNIALTPGLQLLNPQPLARTQLRTIAAGLTQGKTEGKENFAPLPYVKVELEKIKSEVANTQVLLDQKFTTNAIENAVKSLSAPVVHLATHGQFGSKAEDTFILTNDDRIDVDTLNSLLKTRETNQRSAIELLVLSACSTASGDKQAALGIAGFAVRSGARSTLASLWVVDDEATSVIMGEFYKQLKKPNISKAEAFKLAQLSLLKDPRYEHPYYWAPYVLVGNWL